MSQECNETCGPTSELRFLRMILDAAPGMIAYWGSDLRCHHANRAYLDWFGLAPEKVIGMHMAQLLGERLFKLNEPYIRGALDGKAQRFERTLTKADGSIGYTLANYVPDFDKDGRVAGFSVLVSDVTPLKLAEFQAEGAQARLQAVLDSVADCIITVDGNWAILSINAAGLQMFGYQAEQLLGRALQVLIPGLQGGVDGAAAAAPDPELLSRAPSEAPKMTGRRSDGHHIPIELCMTRVATPGDTLYVGVVHDLAMQQEIQAQLTRLALADGMTGLANRRHFDEVLALELNVHIRSGKELSLILIDVDYFKQYNDRYGHVAGDDCLRQIAMALKRVITRTTDLAARYGGEEYACILPMTDQAGALLIAGQIHAEVARLGLEHACSGVANRVTVSIGIASAHCTSELSAESFIKLADARLYAAKQNGRNQTMAAQPGQVMRP